MSAAVLRINRMRFMQQALNEEAALKRRDIGAWINSAEPAIGKERAAAARAGLEVILVSLTTEEPHAQPPVS